MRGASLSLIVLLAFARCGGQGMAVPDGSGTCSVSLPLVDPMLWTLTEASLDPFTDRFDAGTVRCADAAIDDAGHPDGAVDGGACTGPVRCGSDEARFELFGDDGSLQIDTRSCNWATLEQPALIGVEAGEARAVRVWYFAQTPAEPTTAVVSVAFGDEPVWQDEVDLPASRGSLLYDTTVWPASIEPGGLVRFHLHNHGSNSWNLLELTVLRPMPCNEGD